MEDQSFTLRTKAEPAQALGLTGTQFDPIRVGMLADLEMDVKRIEKVFAEPLLLAFEEAIEAGQLNRPVELIVEPAFALPHHDWQVAVRGLERLKERGCIAIMGPLISDNARTLRPTVERLEIPCITWSGTSDWFGEYCFRLGNGGCTEEGQLMGSWLKHQGIETVGILNELSPNGREYFESFRWACHQFGLRIVGVEMITQTPTDLEERLSRLKESGAQGLAYMGFGWPTTLMRPMFERLDWDPPRIMTTAFQFCYRSKEWMQALKGWVGLDQVCEENPLYPKFLDSFEAHFGWRPPNPNTVPVLSYDSGRVMAEGMYRCDTLSGPGMKHGIERMRFAPSATGGPRTHIAAGPYDHQMFKGDWLLYRSIEESADGDVRTKFEGLFNPLP